MIHICLSSDANYVSLTKMCIYDIIVRKYPDTEITFYILADKIPDKRAFDLFNKIDRITCITIQLDSDIIVPEIDTSRLVYTRPGLPRTMYLRFLIPTLKEFQDVDRVLYIDPDMLARRDVSELYHTDLCDKALGMTKDSFYIRFPDWNQILSMHGSGYNAGLILMELPKLRELDFTTRCLNISKEHSYNDQAAINAAMKDEIYPLLPTAQFPIHNLIQHISGMNELDKWNEFHNTKYQHWSDILEHLVFYHFHEDKSWQMQMPVLRALWDFSKARLERFEETGIVEPIGDHDKLIDKSLFAQCDFK